MDIGPHESIGYILRHLCRGADNTNGGRQDAVPGITHSDAGNLGAHKLGIHVVEPDNLGSADEEVVGTHECASKVSKSDDDHVVETVMTEGFIDLNFESLYVVSRASRTERAETREIAPNRSGRDAGEITESLRISLGETPSQHLLGDPLIHRKSGNSGLRQLAIAINSTRHDGDCS